MGEDTQRASFRLAIMASGALVLWGPTWLQVTWLLATAVLAARMALAERFTHLASTPPET